MASSSQSQPTLVQTQIARNGVTGRGLQFRTGEVCLQAMGSGYQVRRIQLGVYAKRLDRGRFVWPAAQGGAVSLTPAQLSMLLEGIDWRRPARTWRPELAG